MPGPVKEYREVWSAQRLNHDDVVLTCLCGHTEKHTLPIIANKSKYIGWAHCSNCDNRWHLEHRENYLLVIRPKTNSMIWLEPVTN